MVLTYQADQNIRVSADEMRKLGRIEEGIEFPDGGYFASLMVYHQLHCIVSVPLHHRLFQRRKDLRE